MVILVFAVLLAMLLGFAAHRASICMVRTVAEIMSARTGYMLVSVGKSVLWVWAVTIPIFWLMPALGTGISGWSLTGYAMLGGLLFGVGAALNGGCAFSTMARLVDGDGKMLATVCGFAVGVFCFVALVGRQWLSPPSPAPALIGELLGWTMVSAFAFLAWAVYESARLWLTRETGEHFTDFVLAPRYRLHRRPVDRIFRCSALPDLRSIRILRDVRFDHRRRFRHPGLAAHCMARTRFG